MSIGDEDITLEPKDGREGIAEPNAGRQDLSEPNPTDQGGEGAADGGANPHGHDDGADGSAGAGEGTADGGANVEGHDDGADGSA
jgi:hypothetical protein